MSQKYFNQFAMQKARKFYIHVAPYELRLEKTSFGVSEQVWHKLELYNHRRWLEALKFWI